MRHKVGGAFHGGAAHRPGDALNQDGLRYVPCSALQRIDANVYLCMMQVQGAFAQLFGFKAVFFAEELASILATPFILYFSLPRCAGGRAIAWGARRQGVRECLMQPVQLLL